jgi:quercetin dioxygenase-like cupin family protein
MGAGMKRYSVVPPGGGAGYDWSRDHTFVKVSSADSAGAFALMEDNLKTGFALGLHPHRQHAETFYILDGDVDFYLDGDWITAPPGTTVHIPPGVEHAVVLPEGRSGKLLMIFQPAGFDRFLKQLSALSEAEPADEKRLNALSRDYDIVELGGVPPR